MDLAIDRKVILKEERQEGREPSVNVYTSQAYYLELNTARMLQELNIVCADQEEKLRQNVARMEKSSGIVLDEGQRQAVVQAVKNGLMILTGGPGTGKTTTINAMIRYFEGEGLEISLAAPTGRAAKRMKEATGHEASTIHRLLELSGMAEESSANIRFEKNAENLWRRM